MDFSEIEIEFLENDLSDSDWLSSYKVKLLNGFHAGKTYYLIAEELKKNFTQDKKNEEAV